MRFRWILFITLLSWLFPLCREVCLKFCLLSQVRAPRQNIQESEGDEEDMEEDIVFDIVSQNSLTRIIYGIQTLFLSFVPVWLRKLGGAELQCCLYNKITVHCSAAFSLNLRLLQCIYFYHASSKFNGSYKYILGIFTCFC